MLTLLWLLLSSLLLDTDGGGDHPPEPPSDDEPPPDDEIKDPLAKIKSLQDANGRLARRRKEAEAAVKKRDARISELEAELERKPPEDQLRAARLETAFLRAVMAGEDQIADVGEGWDLANMRGFLDLATVNEDGTVTGMDTVLEKLLERYPWLSDADSSEEPPARPSLPSTSPMNSGRQPTGGGFDRKTMEQRFPALRRGRR